MAQTAALPCYQWALVDAAPTILQIRAFSTLEQKCILFVEKMLFPKGRGGGNGESPSKPLTPLVPSNVTLR